MIRTSTAVVWRPPIRRTSRFSRAGSFGWRSSGSSPISSMNSVPPLACSEHADVGGVGAGEDAALVAETARSRPCWGPPRRSRRRRTARSRARLSTWTLSAIKSLPVPVSLDQQRDLAGRDALEDRRASSRMRGARPTRPRSDRSEPARGRRSRPAIAPQAGLTHGDLKSPVTKPSLRRTPPSTMPLVLSTSRTRYAQRRGLELGVAARDRVVGQHQSFSSRSRCTGVPGALHGKAHVRPLE